jgi:hypothetical protein
LCSNFTSKEGAKMKKNLFVGVVVVIAMSLVLAFTNLHSTHAAGTRVQPPGNRSQTIDNNLIDNCGGPAGYGYGGEADFNGDGYLEAYCHTDNGSLSIAYSIADGSGYLAPQTVLTGWCVLNNNGVFGTTNDYQVRERDYAHNFTGFTNSGKADIYCHYDSGDTFVGISTGSGFNAYEVQSLKGWCVNGEQFLVGDFNGDGLSDFYCFYWSNGTHYVATSAGDGITFNGWASTLSGWCNNGAVLLGDFRGNGITDVACHYNTSGQTYVVTSTGTSFVGGWPTLNNWCASTSFDTEDMNGDGKTDLYCGDPVTTALSDGSQFIPQ